MTDLYLMRAPLDMVNLARYAAEQRHSDPDRTAHCLVTESFGPHRMPRPFVIKSHQVNGKVQGTLLAYTRHNAAALQVAARQHQRLAHTAVLDPDRIETIRVPDDWAEEQLIRFEVRVRPTKRLSPNHVEFPNAEHDVYPDYAPALNRAEAYCQWLSDLMQRQGGFYAAPHHMMLTKFAWRSVRRQKLSKWTTGPDATITGTAAILNPEKMQLALAQGIGRHKGFGYGMLLLQPHQKA